MRRFRGTHSRFTGTTWHPILMAPSWRNHEAETVEVRSNPSRVGAAASGSAYCYQPGDHQHRGGGGLLRQPVRPSGQRSELRAVRANCPVGPAAAVVVGSFTPVPDANGFQTFNVELPDPTPPGSYQLTVTPTNKAGKPLGNGLSAAFEVTIGTVGPRGPKGDKGDKGDQGPIGPIGLTGATGATGASRSNRTTGTTRAAGAEGRSGHPGDSGNPRREG